MAIEADFQAILAPLVNNRCYPLVAPEDVLLPYITYQVVSNVPLLTLDGQTGTEQLRIQVDFWAATYKEVKDLESAAKALIQTAPFVSLPMLSVDGYEPETKLRRVTTDFSVWKQ